VTARASRAWALWEAHEDIDASNESAAIIPDASKCRSATLDNAL
jgi:hypothetical protein